MKPESEQQLAETIAGYLTELGWTLYFEVSLGYASLRADIVAVQGPILWVIETKTTFGLSVIDQARDWLRYANRVSVGVPFTRNRFATEVAKAFGMGVLKVASGEVHEELRAPTHRHFLKRLRSALCEEQKTYSAPGNAGSDYFSPFKRTIRAIHDELRRSPGLTMKELVGKVEHHYSSDQTAVATIPRWIRQGVIPKIRGEGERPTHWFYDDTVEKKTVGA